MAIAVSDELLGTFVPIAVYWLYSGLYVALDGVDRLSSYRLHPKAEEAAKNVVSRAAVVRGVLVQQAFQVVVALTLFAVIPLLLLLAGRATIQSASLQIHLNS
jgi:sphinganine C4-monooxygenase